MERAALTREGSRTGGGLDGLITVAFQIDLSDLERTRSATGDAIVEDISLYSDDRTRLFVWFHSKDHDPEEALVSDPYVGDFRLLLSNPNWSLYRIVGTDGNELADFYKVMTGADSLLLDARVSEEGWTFRTLIPDRRTLTEFRNWSEEKNLGFFLKRVHGNSRIGHSPYDLSDAQWEILHIALDMGYYEIPREATLSALAAEVGISDQAASERMRRGIKRILEHTVTTSFYR